jgi:hypothetical protein
MFQPTKVPNKLYSILYPHFVQDKYVPHTEELTPFRGPTAPHGAHILGTAGVGCELDDGISTPKKGKIFFSYE